jgi:release factor glutamine methyltransferase
MDNLTIAEILLDRGPETPDFEILLANILSRDRSFLYAHPEYILTPAEGKAWREGSEMLMQGRPLAYVLNSREFYGLDFYVDERVLIPRPETEGIVDLAIEYAKDRQNLRILELGTGSGAISVSLAKHLVGEHRLVATDISPDALIVARANAEKHGVGEEIEFLLGYLFTPVLGRTFDLILANLPYLPNKEDILNKFEPQLALNGGKSGGELNAEMVQNHQPYLNSGGVLVYEGYNGEIKQI